MVLGAAVQFGPRQVGHLGFKAANLPGSLRPVDRFTINNLASGVEPNIACFVGPNHAILGYERGFKTEGAATTVKQLRLHFAFHAALLMAFAGRAELSLILPVRTEGD